MIIVSRFLEKVKDGIHFITGLEEVFCPECTQPMRPHGRCRRLVRMSDECRHKLSLRVLFCPNCRSHHRELPDFIVPQKHFCAEVIAAICDALDNYDADNSTILRIRHWFRKFIVFGAAILRRLKLEHPSLATDCDACSSLEKLRYYVRLIANVNEWKSISSPVIFGRLVL